MRLWFVETLVFTKRIERLGLEDDLRRLQETLLANPEAGATDPGTGGLRKVRMAASTRGKGKRSGARVHYLWLPPHSVVYLLFVYGKDELDTLEPAQKKQLKRVVELIKAEWG
jgi:mRNA-degrading endonuclease RelE of RelBE toxin-antitoxin system